MTLTAQWTICGLETLNSKINQRKLLMECQRLAMMMSAERCGYRRLWIFGQAGRQAVRMTIKAVASCKVIVAGRSGGQPLDILISV